MFTALFAGAGDEPGRCRQSVERGWRALTLRDE
jgi:hypothetical protein